MIAGLSISLVYADTVDLFSDAFGPHGAKLQRQTDEHFRNQRTIGPVNAHLISWPSQAQNMENIW